MPSLPAALGWIGGVFLTALVHAFWVLSLTADDGQAEYRTHCGSGFLGSRRVRRRGGLPLAAVTVHYCRQPRASALLLCCSAPLLLFSTAAMVCHVGPFPFTLCCSGTWQSRSRPRQSGRRRGATAAGRKSLSLPSSPPPIATSLVRRRGVGPRFPERLAQEPKRAPVDCACFECVSMLARWTHGQTFTGHRVLLVVCINPCRVRKQEGAGVHGCSFTFTPAPLAPTCLLRRQVQSPSIHPPP